MLQAVMVMPVERSNPEWIVSRWRSGGVRQGHRQGETSTGRERLPVGDRKDTAVTEGAV